MTWDRFIGCDWGTSRFRLRAVGGAAGNVIAEIRSDIGVSALAAEPPDRRADAFAEALASGLRRLRLDAGLDPRDLPIIVSGMASASIGWRELPYAGLPFALDGTGLVWEELAPLRSPRSGPIFLLSGVASAHDVMRGEETQAIGAAREVLQPRGYEDAVLLLPGTHSKHIEVGSGRMVTFRTYMTGELFDVLTTQSVLRHSTRRSEQTAADPRQGGEQEAMREGILRARHPPLTASLFEVRTREVLRGATPDANRAFLNGLLIGSELEALADGPGVPIVLCAGQPLQRQYATVAEVLGLWDRLHVVPSVDVDRLSSVGQAVTLAAVRRDRR